jgi:SAM-dependent methyltransferase
MMFGLRHKFDYYVCDGCGLLQIGEYPKNLADYYPQSYYSISNDRSGPGASRLVRWVRRRRASYEMGRLDPIGGILTKLRGSLEFHQRLRFAGAGFDTSILDVGCGDGAFLRALREIGFTNLEGVDPFTREADRAQPGFVIRPTVADVTRRFQFIQMDDSFEHMPDQVDVLTSLRRVCAPGGCVCVDIPIVGEAWRVYQTDWVQLDPPRHLYLHTKRSMELIAQRAGYTVAKVVFNSTSFQFWGSEQYRKDIPLTDPRGYSNPGSTLFTAEQMANWDRKADGLNRAELGDHATFFLRPDSAAVAP